MVSNNSSGMCCGVSQNTYHTLQDMRVVFADGTVLDTADQASRDAFLKVCFHQTPPLPGALGTWALHSSALLFTESFSLRPRHILT